MTDYSLAKELLLRFERALDNSKIRGITLNDKELRNLMEYILDLESFRATVEEEYEND